MNDHSSTKDHHVSFICLFLKHLETLFNIFGFPAKISAGRRKFLAPKKYLFSGIYQYTGKGRSKDTPCPCTGPLLSTRSYTVLFCILARFSPLLFFIAVVAAISGIGSPGFCSELNLIPSSSPQSETSVLKYPAWWGPAPRENDQARCKEAGSCITCHEDHATMDALHAIACVKCHRGNAEEVDQNKAHEELIRDPGDLKTVDVTCGQCHPKESRRVAASPMSLAPRMINHTRFAFGSQKTSEPTYATVNFHGLKQVPHPSESLGDDLLRRSCLRCHLRTSGSDRWGEHRGLGCSACHVAYPNAAKDKHTHALTRNVSMTACLKCHNSNHVGADYVGLFEKDSERGFRSPFAEGKQGPRIYGSEQHRLATDVHFKAGMTCMDCHVLDEIHGGTGAVPKSTENGVRISCQGCHESGDHPAVSKDADGNFVLSGDKHLLIPRFNNKIIPHKVLVHREKLRCSACHAAWSFQDYGLHLMLEERSDYWKWATNAAQNDPQIQELLRQNVGTYAELLTPREGPAPPKPENDWQPPATSDWLTGEKRSGAWFRGYTERTWSRPPLGLDGRGRISVVRPMHQYVISHVDADSRVLMDRHIPQTGAGFPALIINPYAPHSIGARGRACEECHGNPKAVGLGEGLRSIEKGEFKALGPLETNILSHSFRWNAFVDEKGNALQHSSHPSAGALDAGTVLRLLNPSAYHRALWYRYLSGESGSQDW